MTERPLPPVRYTRTSDGVSIAYVIWPGESPAFLQSSIPGAVPHLAPTPTSGAVEVQAWFAERFAQGRSVVWFDWRGTGHSERRPAVSLGELLLDLEAVTRVVEESPDLVTSHAGCIPACAFVAQRPHACRSLTLFDPIVRTEESLQGTLTRGGYHDYDLYLYSVARALFPNVPNAALERGVREWARQVPEPVHRAYMKLLAAADVSATLPSIGVPVLVFKTTLPSSTAGKVASLVPGSAMVERDYTWLGKRARADWDEHIGSRFGDMAKPRAVVPDGLLTTQEQTVLARIAEGRTNAQIAEALTVSERTVERHVQNVFAKLRVSNRTEAAVWWVERRS